MDFIFSQSRKAQFSEIRPDECIVQVLVVLKGVVLQTTLQLAPKIEHLIDSYIPGFCFDSVKLVIGYLRFLLAEFFQRLGVEVMPFAVSVCPTVLIGTVFARRFTGFQNDSVFIFSFCLSFACHSNSFLSANNRQCST